MLRDQININTYLNVVITIILAFFGYIGFQYEKRFDSLERGIRENRETMNRRFEQIDRRFEQIDRRFEQILSVVNDNKVNITKVTERQNYSDIRVQNLETAFNIKGKIK